MRTRPSKVLGRRMIHVTKPPGPRTERTALRSEDAFVMGDHSAMTSKLSAHQRHLLIVIVTLTVFATPGFAQTVSFRPAVGSPVAVGGRLSSIAAADFNGDGRLDVAVVNSQQNTVAVFL